MRACRIAGRSVANIELRILATIKIYLHKKVTDS